MASSRPVRIGITAHMEMVVPAEGDGSLHYVVSAPYVKAVRKAGAMPVLLPVVDPDDAAAMLEMVDALIITGGADVDPINYNAAGRSTARRDRSGARRGRPGHHACRGRLERTDTGNVPRHSGAQCRDGRLSGPACRRAHARRHVQRRRS